MNTPKNRVFLNQRSGGIADLKATLTDAHHYGFDGVELDLPELGVTFGGKIIPSALRAVQTLIRNSQLGTSLHAPLSLNLLDHLNIDLHLSVARASIEVAAELEAHVIVIHPGWTSPQALASKREDLMLEEREHLEKLAEFASQRGVRIALENMPVLPADKADTLATYGQTCFNIAEQLSHIQNPAMMACLDFSHAAIACAAKNMDLKDDVHSMFAHIGHIHLHDSFARPASVRAWTYEEGLTYGQGDIHLPLGWGNLDFAGTLEGFHIQPDTIVTLEIQDILQTPEALSESLAKARTLLTNLSKPDC